MTCIHFIGIDVSKDWFDAATEGAKAARFPNDGGGFAAFVERHAHVLPEALVVLESTGGYERALVRDLVSRGVAVHRADPRAASYFIRSLGRRAKTDGLDAAALARYGAERHASLPLCQPHDEIQETLNALLTRRTDLVAMRVAERNRLQHPNYARLQASVNAVLVTLDAEISHLESRIDALIEQSPQHAARRDVMTAVKGVGRQTAITLLACMPELGTLTRRQAASLAGCAPHPKDSGKTAGYRRTWGGRATVKRALFMAALAARCHNKDLRDFYNRLILNGKKPIVAITAIMRKIITILNAKIRDAQPDRTW